MSADEEDAGYIQFPVTLARQTTATATVDYVTAGLGTCRAGEDYDLVTQASGRVSQRRTTSRELAGRVTFGPNQTRHNIRVGIINDDQVEPNEQFEVRLSTPVNCELDPNRSVGIGTIRSEDQPPTVRARPAVSIRNPRIIGSVMRFDIRLSAATSTAVSGRFYTRNGTALSGSDFTGVPYNPPQQRGTRWVVGAGRTSTTVDVRLIAPIGDATAEAFTGLITEVSDNATLTGRDASVSARIPARQTPDPVAPDPTSRLNVSVRRQPDSRGNNAVVTISRTGNTQNAVAVRLAVSPGTATVGTAANTDMPASSQIVPLGRNISTTDRNLPTRVPDSDQPAETAYAVISQPTGTGATLGPNTRAAINLPSYRTPSLVAFVNPIISVEEFSTALARGIDLLVSVPVLLSRRLTAPVSFSYSLTFSGTDRSGPGRIYRERSGRVTIPAGSLGTAIPMGRGTLVDEPVGAPYIRQRRAIGDSALLSIIGSVLLGLGTLGIGSFGVPLLNGIAISIPISAARVTGFLYGAAHTGSLIAGLSFGVAFTTSLTVLSGEVVRRTFADTLSATSGGLSFLGDIRDSIIIANADNTITGQPKTRLFESINIRTLTARIVISNVSGPVENTGGQTLATSISL